MLKKDGGGRMHGRILLFGGGEGWDGEMGGGKEGEGRGEANG